MGAGPTIRRLFERAKDGFANPVDITHYVLIGDVDDLIAHLAQRCVVPIVGICDMGIAINLNNQRLLRAEKINNERPNHGLATEFISAEFRARELSPQALLRLGRLTAHLTREPRQLIKAPSR